MIRRLSVVAAVGLVITVSLTVLASFADADSAKELFPVAAAAAGVLATVAALLVTRFKSSAEAATEQMTDRLADRDHQLEQADREIERFATVAAHDLQEPLRTILTFTDLLERKHGQTLDTEARDYLLRVAGAAARMRALIEDLLTYARIGQAERQFELVELRTCLNGAVANLEPAILETGATVRTGDLPSVWGNPQGLTQLFTNLISNAIKYRLGDAPEIVVTAEENEREWIIAVKDDGKGIDPINHERIFELFRRLEPRSGASGTGLGLTICKRVVDVHGGRIWVRSAVGKGATFFFSLPIRDGSED